MCSIRTPRPARPALVTESACVLTPTYPGVGAGLQELVVVVPAGVAGAPRSPVRVRPVRVHHLLQVGEPGPVEGGDGLVPEPVRVVGQVGQGAVAADL